MALENVPDEDVESAVNEIQSYIERSLPVRDLTPVEAGEVEARTSGYRASDLGEYEILLRLKVPPLNKLDIIETRGELHSHLRDHLESMERGNTQAPDTRIIASDHPPNKRDSLVFYLASVL